MKSAYERALERLAEDGIEAPREDALTEQQRAALAELRERAEAKRAERKILHDKAVADAGGIASAKELEMLRIDLDRIDRWEERERRDIRAGSTSS